MQSLAPSGRLGGYTRSYPACTTASSLPLGAGVPSPARSAGPAWLLKAIDAPQRMRLSDPYRGAGRSGIRAADRVLEVGCGSGFFTPALSAAVGACGAVDSIDLHPMSVAATRENVGREHLSNVTVTEADAHETAFADGAFDAVVVHGVVLAPSSRRVAGAR